MGHARGDWCMRFPVAQVCSKLSAGRVRLGLTMALLLGLSGYLCGQSNVVYIYDEVGRLVAVVNPSGNTAVYSYDPVGNLLSISQYPSSTVSIISFTPSSGPTGTTVTIYGTGFSTTPEPECGNVQWDCGHGFFFNRHADRYQCTPYCDNRPDQRHCGGQVVHEHQGFHGGCAAGPNGHE